METQGFEITVQEAALVTEALRLARNAAERVPGNTQVMRDLIAGCRKVEALLNRPATAREPVRDAP
jgi:hypothetical protein